MKYFTNVCKLVLISLVFLIEDSGGQSGGKWVWGQNNSPNSGIPSSPSGSFNSGFSGGSLSGDRGSGSVSSPFGSASASGDKIFVSHSVGNLPQSPLSASSSQANFVANNNRNNDIPQSAIRGGSTTQARLIPGAGSFISNAISGSSGSGSGTSLVRLGPGVLSSLVQNVPQIGSALVNLLTGRPTNSANSNTNSNSNLGSGNGLGNLGNLGSLASVTGNCQCIPLNQCFLPNRPNGECQGGNVRCCRTSSGTRAIVDDSFSSGSASSGLKTTRELDRERQISTRVGLLEQIVRGSSNIFDDTLDLILQPFLAKEDQERLATRLRLKNGKK